MSTESPFNRTFFNVILNELSSRYADKHPVDVMFLLADETMLHVCHVEDLTEDYLVVASAPEGKTVCKMHLEPGRGLDQAEDCCKENRCQMNWDILPYALIRRIQFSRLGAGDVRLGFHKRTAASKPTHPKGA